MQCNQTKKVTGDTGFDSHFIQYPCFNIGNHTILFVLTLTINSILPAVY